MMELGLINPEHKKQGKMLHNESHKFESTFIGLTIPTNRSVMFGSLSGSKLGIWVAHGEGKFSLPYEEDKYNVVAKYSYDEYPGNPNGSDYSIAGLASEDGRHLAMMPHLERAVFPWQNAYYPADRVNSDQVTPWIEAFVNARQVGGKEHEINFYITFICQRLSPHKSDSNFVFVITRKTTSFLSNIRTETSAYSHYATFEYIRQADNAKRIAILWKYFVISKILLNFVSESPSRKLSSVTLNVLLT